MKTIKRVKLCLIAFFAVVFASMTLTLVATNVKRADAAGGLDTATFVMDDTGLTLRTNNQVGPRFKVKMEKGLAGRIKSTEDITLSFLIAPRAAFDKANYNYETLLAAANSATGTSAPARIKVADKNKIYEEDDYSWASLVINTSEANRTLDMSVVAYITYYDDKVESRVNRYAATDVEKVRGNLYNVVNTTALSDAVLAKDILENSEFGWYGAGNYPIEISTNEQAEVLKNSGANFSGKVVLANSSVNIPSEIAGNVKTVTEQAVGGNKAEIVLGSGTSYAVDMGTLDGNVVKATIGGKVVSYADGKVTLDFDFKNRLIKHGEQTLTVTVEKDGQYTNYNKEVLIVTKEISDIDSLTAALTPTEGSSVVYGYYRLSKDLSSNGWYSVGYAEKWSAVQRSNADLGFRGTFDGNGKTISSWFYGDGLFGVVGNGAVIKNLTINNKQYQGGNGNFNTLFGYSMMGATMDKVTINILKGGKADIATEAAGGLLTCLGGYGNTLKNVTINAKGLEIDTLFGTGCWFTYPEGYAQNTFENCAITAKALMGLACTDNANKIVTPYSGIDGLTVNLVLDEITAEGTLEIGKEFNVTGVALAEITGVTLDGAEFTAYSFANGTFTINAEAFGVSDAGLKTFVITGRNADGYVVKQTVKVTAELKATEVTLDGNREIVLSSGTTFDIDLGEYTSATALSATLADENATYSNGKLTVADGYKANTQKHGAQKLKVTVQKDGAYYNVIANVLVVTQDITTFEELKSALAFNENNVKFGYYRLKNDLTGNSWYQSENYVGGGIWKNPTGELGFRGTLDGNNLSIRETFWNTGLFGYVGKGAVIKNITFNMNEYNAGKMLFGYSMIGATLDNVEINVTKSDGVTEIKTNVVSGLLTSIFSYGNTFNKVVVNTQNTPIDTLFGSCAYYGYPSTYTENTFVDCTVNAKSLLGLACTNNANKTVTPYKNVKGLTVTLGA